jgi:hypothetical protein
MLSCRKNLTYAEEKRAAKIVQTRRQNDRDRTMARGEFLAGPTLLKQSAK